MRPSPSRPRSDGSCGTHPPVYEPLPEGMWHVSRTRLKPVFDFSRDGVRRSLSESLERLGLDRVDIVYVHDPDDHLDQAIGEALPALAELRDEGVVGAVGAGHDRCRRARAHRARGARPTASSSPGATRFSTRARSTSCCRSACDTSVAVVAGGVFNSGILADPSPGARFDYAQAATPAARAGAARRSRVRGPRRSTAGRSAAVRARSSGRGGGAHRRALARRSSRTNVRNFDLDLPADLWAELVAERPRPGGCHALPEVAGA